VGNTRDDEIHGTWLSRAGDLPSPHPTDGAMVLDREYLSGCGQARSGLEPIFSAPLTSPLAVRVGVAGNSAKNLEACSQSGGTHRQRHWPTLRSGLAASQDVATTTSGYASHENGEKSSTMDPKIGIPPEKCQLYGSGNPTKTLQSPVARRKISQGFRCKFCILRGAIRGDFLRHQEASWSKATSL